MAVTPNYGWPVPVATDLVKDGYEAIADLGDAIDTTVFGLPNKILQLVSTTKTDSFSASIAAGATSAVTGLSATITPLSASSKIYVFGHVVAGSGSGADFQASFVIGRGGTALATATGDTAGSRRRVHSATRSGSTFYSNGMSFHFLDSPATTSATTYDIQLLNSRTLTQTYVVNRSASDTDDGDNSRSVSTITLMEVKP